MRKLGFPNLIEESIDVLQKCEKQQPMARLHLRVQFLRLLKSQQDDSIKAAAQTVGITAKRGYEWWALYRKKELDAYLTLHYKARRSRLSVEQQAVLMKRARTDNGFGSQSEVIEYLSNEFAVSAIKDQSQSSASGKQVC